MEDKDSKEPRFSYATRRKMKILSRQLKEVRQTIDDISCDIGQDYGERVAWSYLAETLLSKLIYCTPEVSDEILKSWVLHSELIEKYEYERKLEYEHFRKQRKKRKKLST